MPACPLPNDPEMLRMLAAELARYLDFWTPALQEFRRTGVYPTPGGPHPTLTLAGSYLGFPPDPAEPTKTWHYWVGKFSDPGDVKGLSGNLHFVRSLLTDVLAAMPAGGADDEWRPARWFKRFGISPDMLRQAAGPRRKIKRVGSRGEGQATVYSVADAREAWPERFRDLEA